MSRKKRKRRSTGRRTAPIETPPAPKVRHRRRSPAIIGSLVVVSVGVSVVLWFSRPPSEPDVVDVLPTVEDFAKLDPLVAALIEEAETDLRSSPGEAGAWGRLGRIYEAHGFVEQAQHSYSIASRLNPNDFAWHYYLALISATRGAADEAIHRFSRAIQLQPLDIPAHYHLGSIHLEVGHHEAARIAFQEVVALAPQSPWGFLGLGKTAWRERLPELAATHLERSRAIDPMVRETAYLLAIVYRALGRAELSQEMLEGWGSLSTTSVMDDPLRRRVLSERRDLQDQVATANGLKAQGQMASAEKIYQSVLAVDPEHFDAHHNLGVLYAQTRRHDLAQPHLEKAAALRPRDAGAHFNLAMLYFETDRPAQSLTELERSLEIDPQHAEARRLYQVLGETSTGSRVFR